MNSKSIRSDLKVTATPAHPLVEQTRAALEALGVTRASRLIVAVSGGPDSLALGHVLQSMVRTGGFAALAVAHVNHSIRPEAGEEEAAVRRYSAEWNVPVHVEHVDTAEAAKQSKKGIEETARWERYEFFKELARTHRFDFVLTAHTANDQAETVLMHLIRGAGVRGLAGIPRKRKLGSAYIIRPLLNVTREEILDYVQAYGLQPVYDSSNEELTYQRNRVRHIVMPALAKAWPDRSPVRAIAGFAERMRELSAFLDTLTADTLATLREQTGLSLVGLERLHGFELHAVLEAWIAEKLGPFAISSAETARISAWLASDSRAFELRGGVRLEKKRSVVKLMETGAR